MGIKTNHRIFKVISSSPGDLLVVCRHLPPILLDWSTEHSPWLSGTGRVAVIVFPYNFL
jgi:hypothetical protein